MTPPAGLQASGITGARVHYNLPPAELLERAVQRGEGRLTAEGAFVGNTRPHTGRSPDDKFVVREPGSEQHIAWGKVNVPFEPEQYHDRYREAVTELIEAKLEGKEVVESPEPRETKVLDLAEALARSVAAAKKGKPAAKPKREAPARRRTRTKPAVAQMIQSCNSIR